MIGVSSELFLLVILLLLNLFLCLKRIPIAGLPISVFTIFLGAWSFINYDVSVIPANPYTTVLLTIIAVSALLANGMELTRK